MGNGNNDGEVCPSIPRYYYIRSPAVLLSLVGLNLQLAVVLTVHYSAWHSPDSKRLQEGVGLLRFNCDKMQIY
ncbi:MAG: hypothetical protein WAK17_29885 [Candidatus Nitrosopolaris sp.]